MRVLAILTMACLGACVSGHRERVEMNGPLGRVFEGVIDHPERSRGAGVLLLAGGYVSDIDWTVPGALDTPNGPVRLTIDGRPTTDGRTLAEALTEAGFVVMRYSSIHRDDRRHDEAPWLAEPLPFEAGVELARVALERLRAEPGVKRDRVLLVGHSLGATRACLIADEGVAGVVCLAGAYLSRTRESPRGRAERALARAGLDEATPAATWAGPDADRDADGLIRGWEIAAAGEEIVDGPRFSESYPWPVDRLASLGTPALAVFGGLDPISVHGATLERLDHVRVEYHPDLGHQLSRVEGDRVGAIDPGVVRRVRDWLVEGAERAGWDR